MEDDVHEVVKLLVARMESHPEEFRPAGRWDVFINLLIPFTTPEERLLLRGPRMKMLHELVLNELLNGPERRNSAQTPKPGQYMSVPGPRSISAGNVASSQRIPISTIGQNAMHLRGVELDIGGEKLDAGTLRKIKEALGL